MTMRVWVMSLAALALITSGWIAGVSSTSWTPLRSPHSEPARSTPDKMVAVTEQGKLFHDPSCPLIHGPSHLESARTAVLGGYTPCTRCLAAE